MSGLDDVRALQRRIRTAQAEARAEFAALMRAADQGLTAPHHRLVEALARLARLQAESRRLQQEH